MFGSSWPVCKLAGAEHKQVCISLYVLLLIFGLLVDLILHLIFDHFEGGGSVEGAGLPPLEGGEGENLLLQCHQILQPKNLRQSSAQMQFVKAYP